jgi:hypothetical protein
MGVPKSTQADDPRPVRVLSVPALLPVGVCFLGPIMGLNTHHYGERTQPCLGEKRCPPLRHKSRAIWKGYAPVEAWDIVAERWIPCVLEVTEGLDEILHGRKLAGEVWLLSREGGKKNSPVVAVYSETLPAGEHSLAFSVLPTLERMYHTVGLEIGISNPIPRQMRLRAREGPAPRLIEELLVPPPEELPATPEQIKTLGSRLREAGKETRGPSTPTTGPQPSTNGHTTGKGGKR